LIRAVIFDLDGTLLDRNTSLYHFVVDQYARIIHYAKSIGMERYTNRFIELDHRGYVWKVDAFYTEPVEYDGKISDLLEIERFIEQWNLEIKPMK